MELKKTPLYEAHVKNGGQIVDFGGWALPVRYTSDKQEHFAVRQNVGIFDVSHMGEIDVKGAGCYDYLQNLVTNDITSMTDNKVRYTTVAYENGFTVDDILIYKYNDTHYLLVRYLSTLRKERQAEISTEEAYKAQKKAPMKRLLDENIEGYNKKYVEHFKNWDKRRDSYENARVERGTR